MKKPYRMKKRGDVYYYMLPWEKCFHTTGLTRRREAEHYALAELEVGQVDTKTTYFRDFAERFFDWDECRWMKSCHQKGRNFSKATASWRRGHVVNYLIPYLGEASITTITPNDIDNMLYNIDVAPPTKNKILDSVSIILDMAVRDGLISRNPTELVKRFQEKHKKRDIFSREELKSLFPYGVEDLCEIWGSFSNAAFFATLAFTGIRVGECRVLEWDDILFDYGLIKINKALKNDGGIGSTKNYKSRLAVPTDVVNRLLLKQKETSQSTFVFPEMMTAPCDRNQYKDIFATALSNVGIPTTERNLVPHSFRHTFNTLLRNKLGEDSLAQKVLGHNSSEMTDHYYNPTIRESSDFFSRHKKDFESMFDPPCNERSNS